MPVPTIYPHPHHFKLAITAAIVYFYLLLIQLGIAPPLGLIGMLLLMPYMFTPVAFLITIYLTISQYFHYRKSQLPIRLKITIAWLLVTIITATSLLLFYFTQKV